MCVLGPSGCGKTTALRIAAGLEPVQAGQVRIDGEVCGSPSRHIPPESRNVGLVFQDFALFPHLTVAENVGFGLGRVAGDARRRRVGAVLDLVGMSDAAAAYPHMLSGGQQQRVALARAMAPNPTVLLLDEPFSGLDARLREQVRDDTLHILKENGTTTLVVTHDPEEAMFLGDAVAVMNAGRLEQVGPPDAVYYRPASAFVAQFLSEVNRISGVVHREWVDTPVGRFAARGHADQTPVEVLIRPEAIHVKSEPACGPFETATPGVDGPIARVMASRLLGRTSLIHLSVRRETENDGRGEGDLHLHARVPGRYLPPPDTIVGIALDRSQAFVFAQTDHT